MTDVVERLAAMTAAHIPANSGPRRPRALITGISGFVGSHLAEYLIANTDWDITGMLRWRSPLDNLESIVPLANAGKCVTLVYADLRDTLSIQSVVKESRPDFVFHLAAQSFPRVSFDAPLETLDTNVLGTVRLLDALATMGADPLIHICSSSEVYGRVATADLPITENTHFHPASPYAISKVGADLFAQHYAEAYGMRILTTRMFTHTGPRRGDVFAESSFAKQIAMIEAGLIPPVLLHGNLDSMRTVADVRDAVRAYHTLLTVDPRPGAVYNIGGDRQASIATILQTLISISGVPGITLKRDAARLRPIDADNQVPDTSPFRTHTGWSPAIPFEQTLSDLLAYWRMRVSRDGNRILQR